VPRARKENKNLKI